jgi:hypothetical protein
MSKIAAWLPFLIFGLFVGIGAGVFYAVNIDPRIVTDVSPDQLSEPDKLNYLIALSLGYNRDRRIENAALRLLNLGKEWQDVADAACELTQSGYAGTNTGLTAIRAMVELAASQGVTGCASALIPSGTATPRPEPTRPSPTPTLPPVPTKTPTLEPTQTEAPRLAFTPTPAGEFAVNVVPFCDTRLSGVLEITVREVGGRGIPGVGVAVIWPEGRGQAFTGLKPERDPGYADYVMASDQAYQLEIPGRSQRSARLEPLPCTAQGGGRSRASYRVIFQRVGG